METPLTEPQTPVTSPNTFGEDSTFLKKHTDAVVLSNGESFLVVVPEYQGRVMTTSAQGNTGASSGWINYDLVKTGVRPKEETQGTLEAHVCAFGGEERFWLGPEGGQFSIFFKPETPFEFDDWFTPAAIDTDAWRVTQQDDLCVTLKHNFGLVNHSGTQFKVGAERTVCLLDPAQLKSISGITAPKGVDTVAYQTVNTVTNKGEAAWEKDSGLLSIWMLCMFKPSPTTTIFIPYHNADDEDLGKVMTSDYFGEISADRLKADDGVIYFKGDGASRGKIGISPERSKGMAASYDPAMKRLTVLVYEQPDEHSGYVNSLWEQQEHPYQGDAINSYNDGPVGEDGEQIGPFYELESSSPALSLAPGKSATHAQTIVHFYGEDADLQHILNQLGKIDIQKVKAALV